MDLSLAPRLRMGIRTVVEANATSASILGRRGTALHAMLLRSDRR
jgi:hypothetical protein